MKYDWASIKKDYVQGIEASGGVIYPTFEDLAKKYGCNHGYLRLKAGREKWTDQRDTYKAKIEQKIIENRTNKLAAQQADFDFDVFQTTKVLMNMTKLRIKEVGNQAQKGELPSLNELDHLARVVRHLQEIGKRALGEEGVIDDSIKIQIEKV